MISELLRLKKYKKDYLSFYLLPYCNNLNLIIKILVILDSQTTANYLSFFTIKTYYINSNWKLKERLLDFLLVYKKYTKVMLINSLF